ncbi:putative membrane protein required for colicin V production [Bacillus ectoiniformans]|uniref:CvpA family protein n=1 Tax=Bacillus ectoiniformans TaxID=1494429 RepID=UPI00195966C1|nr:CvpA family protein [Bacillus ectoiniformans]MBM7648877.1 putative membrane protein required for colicin V production [Bacillus ectoiniformans]
MLTIILLLFLVAGITMGLRRGFILQFFHMASSIIAIILAIMLRGQIVPILKNWIPLPPVEGQAMSLLANGPGFAAFYYGTIAFILIFIVVKIALSVLASFMNMISHIPIIREVNKIGGGVLGFLEIYLVLFVLLYIGMLIPESSIQEMIHESQAADYMINRTPFLSEALKDLEPLNYLK